MLTYADRSCTTPGAPMPNSPCLRQQVIWKKSFMRRSLRRRTCSVIAPWIIKMRLMRCLYNMYVCMYVCMCVYIYILYIYYVHRVSSGEVGGTDKCKTFEGRAGGKRSSSKTASKLTYADICWRMLTCTGRRKAMFSEGSFETSSKSSNLSMYIHQNKHPQYTHSCINIKVASNSQCTQRRTSPTHTPPTLDYLWVLPTLYYWWVLLKKLQYTIWLHLVIWHCV